MAKDEKQGEKKSEQSEQVQDLGKQEATPTAAPAVPPKVDQAALERDQAEAAMISVGKALAHLQRIGDPGPVLGHLVREAAAAIVARLNPGSDPLLGARELGALAIALDELDLYGVPHVKDAAEALK
jgi:acyl transferase domain-containing protein